MFMQSDIIVDRAFALGEPLGFASGDEEASEEHFGLGGGEWW